MLFRRLRSRTVRSKEALFLLLPAFAFALGGLAPFARGDKISPADEKKFEDAMSSMDRRDFARAEQLLRDLHSLHPDNFEINESLGLAYAAQNQLRAALPFFRRAAREEPKQEAARANLGTTYLQLSDGATAVRELSVAAGLDPGNVQVREALGQAWMLIKQPLKAQAEFEAALSTDGQNPDLLYNIALASYENGDFAHAADYLSRIPGLASSASWEALYGDIEEKLGDYKGAAQHYALAAKLEPNESNVYDLGVDFLRHWSFEPAEKEFEAGVKRFPQSNRMRFALGVAYYGGERYDRAIPIFADLLKSDENRKDYASMLGLACSFLSEGVDPRCSAVVDFAKRHPENGVIATYAATSLLHRQYDSSELKVAHALLEQAIRCDPKLPDARFAMGVLLQEEGQWERSIPELQAAIRNRPDYPHAHYRLALAYSRTGHKEEAKREVNLEKRYSATASEDLDKRMNEITTLVVRMQ